MTLKVRRAQLDRKRPILERFSGKPEHWLYLVQSWGEDAAGLMRAGDDRARYSAELAARFAHKGGFVGKEV